MELNSRIRNLILGAAFTFSVVGMPAVHAFAAQPQGGTLRGQVNPVVVTAKAPVVKPDLAVQGGSTGQPGSASDDECQGIADAINGSLSDAQQELNTNGMTASWNSSLDDAKSAQNAGEDAGCFFVNPPF